MPGASVYVCICRPYGTLRQTNTSGTIVRSSCAQASACPRVEKTPKTVGPLPLMQEDKAPNSSIFSSIRPINGIRAFVTSSSAFPAESFT